MSSRFIEDVPKAEAPAFRNASRFIDDETVRTLLWKVCAGSCPSGCSWLWTPKATASLLEFVQEAARAVAAACGRQRRPHLSFVDCPGNENIICGFSALPDVGNSRNRPFKEPTTGSARRVGVRNPPLPLSPGPSPPPTHLIFYHLGNS